MRATMSDASIAELREEVRELARRWRLERHYEPRSDAWMRGFDLDFSRALAERGLIGMTWPRALGGGEHSNVARLAVTEELLRSGLPVAAHWIGDRQIGPSLLRHGSAELQEEILPRIAAADYVFCLGMSEPGAGSDLAAVRTLARRVDGGFVLSGQKAWTTNAHRATHAYVLARTDRDVPKHEGLTEFVVDMDAEGVAVSPVRDIAGEHHFNEVTFDEVYVPASRVIGHVGNGWRQVVEQLSFERGGPERILSTYPLLAALISSVPDTATADERQAIGGLVASLATLRRLCADVARAMDEGQAPIRDAATLKLLGTAFEREVIEVARRTLGDERAGARSAFGSALLASPGFGIRGGASDVLVGIITRSEVRG